MSNEIFSERSPLGIFWDIENCPIPRNKSASDLVRKIKSLLPGSYQLLDFFGSCDSKNLSVKASEELNRAGVTIAHVPATSRNTSDEKIREQMTKFVHFHGSKATVFLISGNINFAPTLRAFKDHVGVSIILMSKANASKDLIDCHSLAYFDFDTLCEQIPDQRSFDARSWNESRSFATSVTGQTTNHIRSAPGSWNHNQNSQQTDSRDQDVKKPMLIIYKIPEYLTPEAIRLFLQLKLENCRTKSILIEKECTKIEFFDFKTARIAKKKLWGIEIVPARFIKVELTTTSGLPNEEHATLPSEDEKRFIPKRTRRRSRGRRRQPHHKTVPEAQESVSVWSTNNENLEDFSYEVHQPAVASVTQTPRAPPVDYVNHVDSVCDTAVLVQSDEEYEERRREDDCCVIL